VESAAAGVMGGLACVKITPLGGGSIRGEGPREPEAEACRLGIRGRGAVEELREWRLSREGGHSEVVTMVGGITEEGNGRVKCRWGIVYEW
jgi:hypothetical protein